MVRKRGEEPGVWLGVHWWLVMVRWLTSSNGAWCLVGCSLVVGDGNMSSACVLFILNEMRHSSATDEFNTTGEGLEWGVLFGFGPGLTVETVVLHSVSI